jgi:hypothetical protein
MTTIAQHTGQNVGGIAKVEFAFPSEFSSFVVYPDFKVKATFPYPTYWKVLYATAKTFSGDGNSENTPSGPVFKYAFKFQCPKDRTELINAFYEFHAYGVVLRITDGNSHVRIYGTPSNPLTSKSKLSLPGEVQNFNGYEIALEVVSSDPAYMEQP